MAKTIRLKYDHDRFENMVTLGEMVDAEANKAVGLRALISHFVTDAQGVYLSQEDAEKELNKLSVGEIKDVAQQFREAIDNDAIPLVSDATSS